MSFEDETEERDVTATRKHKGLAVRIAAWTLGTVGSLVILLVLTVVILLHSQKFHTYVLNTAQQKATDALGVPVHLRDFSLNLGHLDLNVDGLMVEGAAPFANPPLLTLDHGEIGVRIVSLWQRKWYLENIVVDRPIVRVFVDKDGRSNLPTLKSSGDSSSSTSIFDLAIRHMVLDRGEVYYNDRKSVLSADLHDVDLRTTFDNAQKMYAGRLSYADGHLDSGSMQTIPHRLEAEFDATPSTFRLKHAQLSMGASQVGLTATVVNYSNPTADATYDALLDGAQIGKILNSASVPTGQVRAKGVVHYRQELGKSLLESLAVEGDLGSGRLDVKANSLRAALTNLAAHYSLERGDASVKDLSVNVLGGKVTGSGTMLRVGGDSHSKVNAQLRGVSLAELKRLAGASTAGVAVSGGLSGDVSAEWGRTLDDLVAKADASLHGQVSGSAEGRAVTGRGTKKSTNAGLVAVSTTAPAQTSTGSVTTFGPGGAVPVAQSVPVEGAIHAEYMGANKELSLSRSYLKTPQTDLSLNGVIGSGGAASRSSLDLKLQANDLREVEAIADLFRIAPAGGVVAPLGLAGTASFAGTVRGSTAAPHLEGQLVGSNLEFQGSRWKVLRTGVDASPSGVRLLHGDLEPASKGKISFDASVGLSKWAFSESSPVELSLDAQQLNVGELAKLSGQTVPVDGTLSASVKVHGSELNPVGNGNVSVAGLVAYGQPITLARVDFSGTGDEAHADLKVNLPSGSVAGQVSVRPKQKTYVAKLNASGIRLERLEALKARNVDANGEVTLQAQGAGSFDNTQLDAVLEIPQLVIQNQKITGLKLNANVANHRANANLATSAVNTQIRVKAQVDLTGDYMADATVDTQAIPFQPLLAVYAPAQAADISGETEIHATMHGPLKDKNKVEAHLTIPVLKLAYGKDVQLAATAPVKVDYRNGVVALQRTAIKGTDTDLQMQGSYPVSGTGPMSAVLLGTVNLQLAQLFVPDIRTGGEVRFDVNSSGTNDIGGKIEIVNASYSAADLPVGLQNGNGTLTLSRDRLSISKFQGMVGGGVVTAQGGVSFQPKVQFDLGLAAKDIRMLYPQGMREGIEANVRMSGTPDGAVLGGTVNLTDLTFTQAFDLNNFISQFAGGVSSPPTPGFGQNLQLNLAVRSSSNLNLVSRALSIDGSANLQVRGTAANPVILGRVNLNNGDVILNGDRFVLNGGTIQFVNPSETEPVLNVSLKTTIQQYDVYLRFNGPISQLRTNYNSDPALPSADIINLLAFGKTTEANAANPSTPANQAAAGLVASQVSSQVTSRVSKIAGISQLSINPVLAGGTSQGPPGANITIQQRVTGNLFVTFSSNVASTQSQTIQGQYQVSPRVAVSATRDQNGGFGFDALIKKNW